MDAYFKAVDEQRNPMTVANVALQRNGFRRLGTQYSRGVDARDRDVREMEEGVVKRFRAAMTEEKIERLAMSR